MEKLILPNALRATIPARHRSKAEARGFRVEWTDGQFCRVRRDHVDGEHWQSGEAAIRLHRVARLNRLK